jgi:hypothetical protein
MTVTKALFQQDPHLKRCAARVRIDTDPAVAITLVHGVDLVTPAPSR